MKNWTKTDLLIAGIGLFLCWVLWFGPLSHRESRSNGAGHSRYTPQPTQPVNRMEITIRKR